MKKPPDASKMLKPLFRPPRNIGGSVFVGVNYNIPFRRDNVCMFMFYVLLYRFHFSSLFSCLWFNCLGGSVAPGSQELTRRTRDRSPRASMVSNNELRQTIRGTLGVGGSNRQK